MSRKTLGQMTEAEIEAEIKQIEAEPRKVKGHYTRIDNLKKEQQRRIQSQLLDAYARLGEMNKLKDELDDCKTLDEIKQVEAKFKNIGGK